MRRTRGKIGKERISFWILVGKLSEKRLAGIQTSEAGIFGI